MNVYENFVNDNEEKIVRMGRNLITLAEKNELYPKDDEMWNAAMSAGNKMVTIGLPFSRFEGVKDLTSKEQRAVKMFLASRK